MHLRITFSVLCLTTVLLFGCRPASPSATTTPLSFYVVSEEQIEGGRFVDTPNFPKLGYIAASPALVISRLEAVAPDVSRRQNVMVDRDGKETVMPLETTPALNIRMHADDAKNFTTLTEQAVGKRLLIMLGETPLTAPMVQSPIPTQSLLLTLGDKTDKTKIEDALKKLVQ